MVGLAGSSPIRTSPISAAQARQRCNTSWPSRPSIGVRIDPWFSAASRVAVRFFSTSTSGARADSSSFPADLFGFGIGAIDLLVRRLISRAQQAPRGDLRKIAVLQCDRLETRLPPLQDVRETELERPGHLLADQLAQVALPRHEADDRDRAARRLRLDQLRDLRAFLVEESEIRGMGGEPQDQLVEKQHQGVVAEVAGVTRSRPVPRRAARTPRRSPAPRRDSPERTSRPARRPAGCAPRSPPARRAPPLSSLRPTARTDRPSRRLARRHSTRSR